MAARQLSVAAQCCEDVDRGLIVGPAAGSLVNCEPGNRVKGAHCGPSDGIIW